MAPGFPSLHDRIVDLAEDDDGAFAVLQDGAERPSDGWRRDPSRPVMIIVHPGDAIELASDWPRKSEEGRLVVESSMRNQNGMAKEIMERLPTHDVVILHRASSAFLQDAGVDKDYSGAIEDCQHHHPVLYGDNLGEASRWILEHVAGLKAPGLPIFMTGAYADDQYGCITAIGKALLATHPSLRIQVSPWSPTDNINAQPRWNPASDIVLYHGMTGESAERMLQDGWSGATPWPTGSECGQSELPYPTNAPESSLWHNQNKRDEKALVVTLPQTDVLAYPGHGTHNTVNEEIKVSAPGSLATSAAISHLQLALFKKPARKLKP